MFTVALIGPDGAGKTTIGQELEHLLPLPVKYVYMGVNLDASNHMLPTTRLLHYLKRRCGAKPDNAGPRDHNARQEKPKRLWKRPLLAAKSWLSLANKIAEEWFRQAVAWQYKLRRYIVIFDRHYFADYYAYDVEQTGRARSRSRAVHGWLLAHVYPRPDLVIYLDAPAEVLLARKGEGTLELLERRRQDYFAMCNILENVAVVDASQPRMDVTLEVRRQICSFYERLKPAGNKRP